MSITNAQLAQKISDMIDAWRNRELQMQAWISGTATGGSFGDGRYPLSDFLGVVTYTYCPAALQSSVGVSSSSAAASAVVATAAQGAATLEATAAGTSETNALAYRNAAQAARDLAEMYKNNSASSAASALTYANSSSSSATASAASASAAGASETAAATSATHAHTSEVNAAASAVAAAASAVLAATFNPALYALLAGAAFTGTVTSTANGTNAFFASSLAGVQVNALSFKQGAQLPWVVYQPAGSTDFRIFGNSSDRLVLTASGVLTAANLSGTNTGDQNLAPYALLSAATFTGNLAASSGFFISNIAGGTYGGTYAMTNTSAGAINKTKTWRINPVGGLELINDAFTAGIFTVSDSGVGFFAGTLAAANLSGTNTGDQNLAPYAPLSGATFNGLIQATAGQASTIATATGGLGSLWCFNTNPTIGPGGAFMTFHRSGSYAAYFGLDVDNILKYGGWSAGANAYPIAMGNGGTYALSISGNAATASSASSVAWANVTGSPAFALLSGATFTGRVGIGTGAPDSQLVVLGPNGCGLRVDYSGLVGDNYYDATRHNFRNTSGAQMLTLTATAAVAAFSSAASGTSANGVAGIILNNANSSMQTTLEFQKAGVLMGRVRSDFAGNMNYISTGSGVHNFIVGGEFGVGTLVVAITASGLLINGVAPALAKSGSFTGTLTGYASPLTGTFKWVSDGLTATVYLPSGVTGTSNSTTLTITGLPAAVQPAVGVSSVCTRLQNNGGNQSGVAILTAGSGTITLTDLNNLGFGSTGGKGLLSGWSITYPII
jgi:hypothetical protein